MMKFKMFNKNSKLSTKVQRCTAFTLAEVLITLGIIGVVASLTIPTLINKAQKQEFVAGFKKSLSNFSSVYSLLKLDNGGIIAGVYSDQDKAIDAFCTKLKCTKVCHGSDDRTKCFHSGSDWYTLNGKSGGGWNTYSTMSDVASAILTDGTLLNLYFFKNCDVADPGAPSIYICAIVTVDVNGFKPPNKMGRDMFEIYMLPNRVVPNGFPGSARDYAIDKDDCDPTSTTSNYDGATCGARIMQEGGMDY